MKNSRFRASLWATFAVMIAVPTAAEAQRTRAVAKADTDRVRAVLVRATESRATDTVFAARSGDRITIENFSGWVSVEGTDSDEVVVRGPSDWDEAFEVSFEARSDGSSGTSHAVTRSSRNYWTLHVQET